ncbi:uncharacterized protein LOC111708971 isoform X2 [Eurytemora carolleeae]|uniref:uncharacterized protein LOC111708971 isoform X2 n=1 Tax=Eurytemora carolleeae TaxID=1294199 RepID=UPI000C77BA05|nr:uncharacterized protein LOC111708971 isoform X2 [Eurytemora carolleeae]|eukprot:XP_023338268.1 uncharacterized protein LOC111708971 isoform X2 [Eurytemora affinis]
MRLGKKILFQALILIMLSFILFTEILKSAFEEEYENLDEKRLLINFDEVFLYTAYPDISERTFTVLSVVKSSFKALNWSCSCFHKLGFEQGKLSLEIIQDVWNLEYQAAKLQCTIESDAECKELEISRPGNISIKVKVFRNTIYHGKLALCLMGPLRLENASTPESVMNMIGYIEKQKLLGVNRIYFYGMAVEEILMEIIDFYRKERVVEYTPWKFPLNPNQFRYYGQVLLMHDCMYRTRNAFNFTMFLDLDESIVPENGGTIPDLLDTIKGENISDYGVENRFYSLDSRTDISEIRKYFGNTSIPELQEALHLKQDTSEWKYGIRSKFIIRPSFVHQLTVHYALSILEGFHTFVFPSDDVVVRHYRKDPPYAPVPGVVELPKPGYIKHVKQLMFRVNQTCEIFHQQNILNCTFIDLY